MPGQVRGTALQVWSLLIKSARLGAQERGQPNAMAKELLGTGLQVGPVFWIPLGSDTTLMATRNMVNSPVEMVNIPLFTGFDTSQVVVFGKLLDSVFFFKLRGYVS